MGGTLSCSCRCNDAGMTSQVPHKERVHVHKISDCARLLVAKPFQREDVAFSSAKLDWHLGIRPVSQRNNSAVVSLVQRFTSALTGRRASLGAEAVGYSPAVFRRRIIVGTCGGRGTKAPRPTCGLCRKTYRGGGMPLSEVAACYRLYAACCVELARDPLKPGRKVALLDMAQAWARLAEQVEKNSGIRPGEVRKESPLGERSMADEQLVEM